MHEKSIFYPRYIKNVKGVVIRDKSMVTMVKVTSPRNGSSIPAYMHPWFPFLSPVAIVLTHSDSLTSALYRCHLHLARSQSYSS